MSRAQQRAQATPKKEQHIFSSSQFFSTSATSSKQDPKTNSGPKTSRLVAYYYYYYYYYNYNYNYTGRQSRQ